MEPLYNFILESTLFNIGKDYTKEQCLEHFLILNKRKGIEENLLKEFINYVYSIWDDIYNNDEKLIPFRFSNTAVKLARNYELYISDIEKFCRHIGLGCKIKKNRIIIGDGSKSITINFGNGSIFGSKSAKGLEYEEVVRSNIIKFVKIMAFKNRNELSHKDVEETCEGKFKNLYAIYMRGDLDYVCELYKQNHKKWIEFWKDDVNMENLVQTNDEKETGTLPISMTGKANTRRNNSGQIIDPITLAIGSDLKTVLNDSGNIISDLQISSKSGDPVNISVKLNKAQLSGINVQKALNNDLFLKATKEGLTWQEVKTHPQYSKDIAASKTFFNNLGIKVSSIYKAYLNIAQGNHTNQEIELSKYGDYDQAQLGRLAQMLLGGNYWYVNPKYSKWISAKDAKFKFNFKRACIAKPRGDSPIGKTINIYGDINGVNCTIVFRTSGNQQELPYRLFIKTDVSRLVDMI